MNSQIPPEIPFPKTPATANAPRRNQMHLPFFRRRKTKCKRGIKSLHFLVLVSCLVFLGNADVTAALGSGRLLEFSEVLGGGTMQFLLEDWVGLNMLELGLEVLGMGS